MKMMSRIEINCNFKILGHLASMVSFFLFFANFKTHFYKTTTLYEFICEVHEKVGYILHKSSGVHKVSA